MKFPYFIIFFLIFLCSCIDTPVDNSVAGDSKAEPGDIFVLNEGLQGYDNSALTLIKSTSAEVIPDYFKVSNNNEYIGDTANDILLLGDTAIITLSTPSIIRLMKISSGQKINEIFLPDNCTPRKSIMTDDTTLCITCLIRNSVLFVNLKNAEIISEVLTGPQPEGIAFYKNYIFTANSAYGDFNYMHPDAETVSVIDLNNRNEIKKIKSGPNCMEVLVNEKFNKLYAVFINLPSKESEPGGIVEYDLNTFIETNRWELRARSVSNSISGDTLFFISQMHKGSSMNEESGVSFIDIKSGEVGIIYINPNKFDILYGLSVSPYDGTIWFTNARNHTNNGEVIQISSDNNSEESRKFRVLQNPNKIVFIR